MAVPSAYFTTVTNVPAAFASMQRAGVPQRFTHEFSKQLGFAGSRDRPIIAVLKALGFLDQSGVPTDRYRRYKNEAEAKTVLAEGMRDAYADVFTIDQRAYDRNTAQGHLRAAVGKGRRRERQDGNDVQDPRGHGGLHRSAGRGL